MKTLCLFVDSDRADQYLNSVAHGILYENVRAVSFWHIQRPDNEGVPSGYSARVMYRVQDLLTALSERAQYIDTRDRRVSLEKLYGPEQATKISEFYKRCTSVSVSYSNHDIDRKDLRRKLRSIARNGQPYICDVTGLRKIFLGDLAAIALVENLQGLFVFDLIKSPDFEQPVEMLIHNLDRPLDRQYKYVDILDTETYRSCSQSVALRSPTIRAAIAMALAFLAAGLGVALWLGFESEFAKYLNVFSQVAGVVALALAIWPPRPRN